MNSIINSILFFAARLSHIIRFASSKLHFELNYMFVRDFLFFSNLFLNKLSVKLRMTRNGEFILTVWLKCARGVGEIR